ncbi:MAG: hypothetical protein JO024_02245 [Candidatus Eremiobacteraeota bacterium]|nr:hypothetical protein [Candidatus Eremiobacteraeota bacterium]MBV9737822.1 hypothetical protein [Candidatus Eremiobacteraeota bacterium]
MNYIDLSTKTVELSIDAMTSAATRALDYAKATFDVMAKPYSAMRPDAIVNENFERTGKLLELRDAFLRDASTQYSSIANAAIDHAKAWQETAQRGFQGIGDVMVSNLNYVKEATGHQIDGFTKHVEAAAKSHK